MQEKRGGQTDRVIAARSFDPRIAVRGYRSEYAAAEFEGIALLADRGTLGTVAGAAEITLCIDRRGADFVLRILSEGSVLTSSIVICADTGLLIARAQRRVESR